MPEVDYYDVDVEAFWGEAAEALVLFCGKDWNEAIDMVKRLRKLHGCDEPGYDPLESMLFHDLPYRCVEKQAEHVRPGMADYYHNKHYGAGNGM